MQYVNLHNHTYYSPLDGVSSPEEYMERAAELGMPAIAITDHGYVSGHRDFQRAAKSAGIKPILGVEAYFSVTDRFDRRAKEKREDGTSIYNHIIILAKNENGLRNLNNLQAESWRSGYYYKPRSDKELLEQYSDDLIVLSGCLNGPLSKPLEQNNYDEAVEWAKWFKGVFGDRFYIEQQVHNPESVVEGLIKISNELNIKQVITSDCHHARKEDLWVQEAMLILSTNPKINKGADLSTAEKMNYLDRFNYLYPDRTMTFQEYDLHLNSAEELWTKMENLGLGEELFQNTIDIADSIEEYPYYEGLDLLPESEEDPDVILKRLVKEGMEKRGHFDDLERREQVKYELKVIADKNISNYFVVLQDLVSFAKSEGIVVGPGRGSGAGSLVNYYLEITDADPVKYGLSFFRFLDPDREDMPDVDVDFEASRRHEVKEYAQRKYGHVGNIATFGRYKDNSAIRDAARVFRVPIGETNKALQGISTIEQFEESKPAQAYRNKHPEVVRLAKALRGRIKSIGMHAGGLVLSREPIENWAPMITAEDKEDKAAGRIPVIGYDMRDAADVGLIKYDILGLKVLSAIGETLRMIKDLHGKDINLLDLDLADKNIYDMLSAGNTRSIFQAEAMPYTKMILSMGGVSNFDELVASNALVRPGAANSSVGEAYINGKKNGEYNYIHKDAVPFTKDTFGAILYQEQQMLLCTEIAGMTMGEANIVRKGIGKKNMEVLAKMRPKFIEGATKKVGEAKAKAAWADLEAAGDYAFNKSHAVAYSMISYWTAWLKYYYPAEWWTATINNETDAMAKMDYMGEAKRSGIRILMPHINKSQAGDSPENGAIRLGLSSVKYISDGVAAKIIANRPYESYADFLAVANKKYSGINARAIEHLNMIGGATFDDNPLRENWRENIMEVLGIPEFGNSGLDVKYLAQMRQLDEYTEDETFFTYALVRSFKNGPSWKLVDIGDETGNTGVFIDPQMPIEKGKMYVMLITKNRISWIATPEEFMNMGGLIKRYFDAETLNCKGGMRAIWYKREDKRMNIVFADTDKKLVSAACYRGLTDEDDMKIATGVMVKPIFTTTKKGNLTLQGLE